MSHPYPDLQEATIQQLQDGLTSSQFTSVDLVRAYIARIHEVNHVLNAVISISPVALQTARGLDEERREGKVRSILHGIPIAIKDNIATRPEDGMDTTCGSYALQGAVAPGDADCIAKLREAGAIILCKLNLSQWANFRGVGTWYALSWISSPYPIYFDASVVLGAQWADNARRSPYFPGGNPCGSSSGSGSATAVGLACVSLGTETGGSIISPSSRCALVGIRPTVGLVSGQGVVPITSHRDTVGPMARTVVDAAIILDALSGKNDYAAATGMSRLDGFTLLLPTNLTDWSKVASSLERKVKLQDACETLRGLGATVVEAALSDEFVRIDRAEDAADCTMETEFVQEIDGYLTGLIQSLKDLIRYTKEDPRESPRMYTSCAIFEKALARPGFGSFEYRQAKELFDRSKSLIRTELEKHGAHAMVLMSATSDMWSHAGWPQITVPLGYFGDKEPLRPCLVHGSGRKFEHSPELWQSYPSRPYGLTFAGIAFSEKDLIKIAYAFEQATQVRRQGKTYAEATPRTQLGEVIYP